MDAFYTVCATALSGKVNAGYDYRTIPDKLNRSFTVIYMGGKPTGGVTAGQMNYMSVAILLGAKHDKTEAGLRQAYRDLNDMETALINAFEGHNNSLWSKILITHESARPRSFIEIPETQLAEVPVRLLLR